MNHSIVRGRPPRAERKRGRPRLARGVVAGTLAALMLAGTASSAFAGVGTGGAAGGSGGASGDYISVVNVDNFYAAIDGNPVQGWGAASTQYVLNEWLGSINGSTGATWLPGDWTGSGLSRQQVDAACNQALTDAINRNATATRARVVSLAISWRKSPSTGTAIVSGSPSASYRSDVISLWDNSGFVGYDPDTMQAVKDAHIGQINSMIAGGALSIRASCVALNDNELKNPEYDLSVSTTAQSTFELSGTTGAVHDRVTLSSDPDTDESVNVRTILHWDGVNGAAAKSVSKTSAMSTSATTNSPNFSPSDFGWSEWPAGKFWYDIQIAKQGNMAAAVDTPDRVASETWNAQFKLGITTDKASTFELAGSTGAVNDRIHADSNSSQVGSKVNADVVLSWDGLEGSGKSVTKQVSIALDGTTTSPNFTPADFGWQAWPAGNFWFDVHVARQSLMNAAVNTPDRDVRETWQADPPPPVKTLTSGDPADELRYNEVLASGMFYNAQIAANSAGYSTMTVTDTVLTDKVIIGAKEGSDVASAVYVLDPEGNKVDSVQVSIDRSTAGRVVVSAKVSNMADKFVGLDYTLVVPTYVLPTGEDYTIEDSSSVCYAPDMPNVRTCIEGNDEGTRKVTPTPDKVWVLDEDGALVTADPAHTNQEGSDKKVFLMNDAVSAVVNGSVPANLAENLTNYQLIDDWTDASQYVDFSDASKASVWYETAKDSGVYTNVTSQFDISVDGTKTTATAKAEFLEQTKGQCESVPQVEPDKCRTVKLVISGQFRDDYDTNGEIVTLTNAGAEVWNNETIPTNEPPVYTWTPNPNKQVLGSSEQDGDKTYENINGLSVFPGQKLEYSVGVDLRVPSSGTGFETARGVKSLAIEDVYDPNFTPDKTSVEIWDSRDATNPKPIAAKNYTLKFDEANHTFTVAFTQEWIDANVNNEDGSANSDWLTQGWLTLRFTGTVNDDVAGGSTVQNQAFQVINGAKTATEIPVVNIPTIEPDKEDLNTDLVDIDGKTVVEGDIIVYRLTLDASVTQEQLAYYVHKLGMVDDYDEGYLDVSADSVVVTNKATGEDVTAKFNVAVADGKLYVFAKQVDSTNYVGEIVPGDPQPEDLAAYSIADIVNGTTPIIDQALMGSEYYITFQAKVSKETDGYVIENQATQNIENTWHDTKIVSNPLKDIDPDKDVVVSEETKDDSINEAEIALNSDFNYRLNSSSIPANRAYEASQWSITDTFDKVYDQYTGIWAVYANEDIYNGDTLVYAKGDLLQDSAGHETEPGNELFTVTFDQESYTFKIEATSKFLDLVNTRTDLSQSFSVYTKMIRIAPSEKVENKATESYNDYDRETNVVWTSTPEHPSIDVEKYTLSEGPVDGDRDDESQAYEIGAATDEQSQSEEQSGTDEGAAASNDVQVGITVTNTGDVALKDVTITDATYEGKFGTVENIVCEAPEGTDEALLVESDLEGDWVSPETITTLAVDQSVDCVGTLTGMEPGMTHGDTVTVTGTSVFTGTKVTDEDPWFAKLASNPVIDIEKYTFSEGLEKGDRDVYKGALELTAEQAANGVQIGFDITNNGDEDLTDLAFTDMTHEATTGTIEDIKWITPVTAEKKQTLLDEYKEAKASAEAAGTAEAGDQAALEEPVFITIGDQEYLARDVKALTFLAKGDTATLIGTFKGVEAGPPHGDTATVTAKGVFSGTEVTDFDPWFAKLADGPQRGAVTGEGFDASNPWLLGAGLLLLAAAGGTAYGLRRRSAAAAAQGADGSDDPQA